MSKNEERWYTGAGVFGHLARAVVFALVGIFLHPRRLPVRPQEAIGLDGALAKLAGEQAGPLLLGVVAFGLLAYGLFCFVQALPRRVRVRRRFAARRSRVASRGARAHRLRSDERVRGSARDACRSCRGLRIATTVQPVPELNDLALARGQLRDRFPERVLREADRESLFRGGVVAGEELAVHGVVRVTDRLVEAVTARAACCTSCTCFSESFVASAISSSVGSRPSLVVSSRCARPIFCSRSTMCAGMRISRALLAIPRWTAWRIHHVAYVENL